MQAVPNTELERISDFKGGLIPVLERQQTHIRILRQVLSSSIITPEERLSLQDVSVNVDRTLTELSGVIRESLMQLGASNLDQEARKNFHNFFSADPSDHRLSYVRFLLAAVYVKRFSMEAGALWGKIRSFLEKGKLAPTSQLREQAIKYRIDPAIYDTESLRVFAERMGRVVQFKQDPLKTRNLSGIGTYSPALDYQMSVVFREDLESYIEKHRAQTDSAALEIMDDLSIRPEKKRDLHDLPPEAPNVLRATGNQKWNSTLYYVLVFDPQLLAEERKKFGEVIYIDTHLGALQDVIRTDFVLQYSRKQRFMPVEKVESDYRTFLNVFFSLAADISLLNAGIKQEYRNSFLFHLGPQTFFQLSKKYLKELQTGSMHRIKGSQSRVVERFVPLEFLKAVIMDWWKEQVLPACNENDREDPGLFRAMVRVMRQRMDTLTSEARKEFDALPTSARAEANKEQLLKELIQRKIGPTNMVVFKRYLTQN
ncbi:MAG: hypothetical protein CMN76_05215 [Spirochaetaceae bacterium]|nr:hypothetical protein [Spirochaetaceae bacterium]|tara:strand:- start:61214 stop:62665 length:1452 start_codon:yes stop_codon:yes gene_type:complete